MKLRMAGASDSAAVGSSRGSAYVWKSLEPLALPDLDGEVGHGRGLSMGRDLRPRVEHASLLTSLQPYMMSSACFFISSGISVPGTRYAGCRGGLLRGLPSWFHG